MCSRASDATHQRRPDPPTLAVEHSSSRELLRRGPLPASRGDAVGSIRNRDGGGALAKGVDEYRLRRSTPEDAKRPRRRRTDGTPRGARPAPIGEALLAAGLIDTPETLSWGLARQAETGERLGQILLAADLVHRLDLQHALGEQWNLDFIDLLHTEVDAELVRGYEPEMLLAEGWIPVRQEGARTIVATCEPPTRKLRSRSERLGPSSKSICARPPRLISSVRSCPASASTLCAAQPVNC